MNLNMINIFQHSKDYIVYLGHWKKILSDFRKQYRTFNKSKNPRHKALKTNHLHLRVWREQVHMMADGLFHGAFKGLVGGSNRQEELVGHRFALREKPFVPPLHCFLLMLFQPDLGRGRMVEEGNGRRRKEASCWKLLSSSGKVKDVLKGDGAPSNWRDERSFFLRTPCFKGHLKSALLK